ncbi:MAG: carboxymuconolactone decarboxylase family protein [Synergistaceae bacterium]|nr:carboxymuconolactone decarboxylase family protein [Synergistaceae bacterium]
MKAFLLILSAFLCLSVLVGSAFAYPVFAPEGHKLKVHWAVVQSKEGKMDEISAIGARTVAKYTPHEKGSYSLYGAIAKENKNIMRLLEIYEDEEAYQVHRASEGFKQYIEERKPILENLIILPVDPVVLEQKAEGRGKFVSMTIVEVNPEKLEEFKALIKQEMTRAVAEDAGVLGLFATTEQGDKNYRFHTMEIYTDSNAQEKYLSSNEYKNYRKEADKMISSRKVFENYPANINLSSKGLHLNFLSEFEKTDPEFAAFFKNFALKEVVTESKLDDATRYTAILATLLGCGGVDNFKAVLPYALDAQVTPAEVKEIIYQAVAYLGIGRVFPFLKAANEVFTAKNISLPLPGASTTTPEDRIEKGNQAQVDIFGEGMKGFQNAGPEETKHINRWLAGNCFGDYYTRKGLDYKKRELITFCFIAAQGGCEPQLTAHAKGNMNVGNDKAFLIDVVSQCLPYIGYPRSLNAITCINKAAE